MIKIFISLHRTTRDLDRSTYNIALVFPTLSSNMSILTGGRYRLITDVDSNTYSDTNLT